MTWNQTQAGRRAARRAMLAMAEAEAVWAENRPTAAASFIEARRILAPLVRHELWDVVERHDDAIMRIEARTILKERERADELVPVA